MIDRTKLAESKVNPCQPDIEGFINCGIKMLLKLLSHLLVISRNLELLSLAVANGALVGNRIGKAASTNTKHPRPFHATIIYYRNICRAATNVGKNSRK